jgi:hypothetical protein
MSGTGRRGGIQVGTPERGHEASTRPPRGRICSAAGCSTILSTYNRLDTCGVHTQPVFKPVLPPQER